MPQVEFFAVASPTDVATFRAAFLDARGGESPNWTAMAASPSPPGEPAILRTLALRPNRIETARPFLLEVIRRCALGVLVGDPLAVDIAWSWIDAWLAHSSSPEHFAEAFDVEAVREAFRTPFLLSELARSVAVSANPERTVFYLGTAMQRIVSANPLSDSSATALGRSIGRIVYGTAPNLVTSPIGLVLVDACMSAGPVAYEAYQTESDICEFLLTDEQRPPEQRDAQSPPRASTAIALADLKAEVARRETGADWTEPAAERHQRVRSLVQGRLKAVPESETWTLLDELASDSDCFIRCAAITHALGLAGAASPITKATAHMTRARAQSCVMRALSNNDHHWLRGALIAAHLDASHSIEGLETDGWSLPSLGSFDLKKFMLTPLGERSVGLAAQLLRFASCRSRVALVLPAIEPDATTTTEQEGLQNNKGSPPLGLGQIATFLSARGHYVHLYDAHRFRFDEDRLAAELAAFDVVGLSLVFSTIRSGQSLTRKIRSQSNAAGPVLVVGGHAPTLMTAERVQQANIQFDYLVIGPGEEAFDLIIREARHTERAMKAPQVVTGLASSPLSEAPYSNNRELAKARSATTKRYQTFLEHLPWIDRDLFADPISAETYEPSPTRNGKDVEAHLVLSRGCDWRCSFCTEALIAGREGENRRSVADILGEIEHLAHLRAVTRIQFIDDNVFPTLPASKRRNTDEVTKARIWAEDLLSALSQLAMEDRQHLRWRGLMRVEDFLRYEELVPDFVHRLAQSGCNLLAFGIECGSEAARSKMKGADELPATNDEIIALVARLHLAGIFAKGYFIIGGPGQGRADAEDTIAFAVASNLDLAYFAIYKDFRGIAQSTGKGDRDDDAALRFRLFAATTLDTASNWSDDDVWEEKFGTGIAKEDRRVHALALADLQAAGFSFGDLVRYNDYHEWIEPYTKMGFDDHHDYLRTLSEAYLRFYARPEWLPRYRALVGSGY